MNTHGTARRTLAHRPTASAPPIKIDSTHMTTRNATPEFHYRWEWQLRSSPDALWPFIADTNRFNRDAHLPSVGQSPDTRPVPPGVRRLRAFRLGVMLEWDEEPFEWVRPQRFGVFRRYHRGPVAQMRVLTELHPRAEGGTRVVYDVWATPRNLLGYVAIPGQIGVLSAWEFERLFRRYDELATRVVARPALPALDLPPQSVEFTPGGRRRLAALETELRDKGADPNLLARLVEVIRGGDDLTVSRLRPYALADHWNVLRRAVLELCLWATRLGLLDFQWDVLCPLCRGAKDSAATLGRIQSSIHCDSCNIDFTANFDRSVELTFRPNPAIRLGAAGEFCVGGPQVTPHIVAQQLLAPNERRALRVPLEVGRYRLRTRDLPGGQFLWAEANGDDEQVLVAKDAEGEQGRRWPNDEPRFNLRPTLNLHNATAHAQLFILERMTWSDQAVTAAEVTAMQTFRDLFATEALRPGEHISVGSLTVLFTDLRDSTRLYRESGDAVAFGRVMSHFDILREAIAAEDGALVKTIGDAVMAVFRRPVAALRAVTRAQQALAAANNDDFALRLKAGIHTGPCVAVTLNDRLDYFGTTVNLAARLEGLSAAREGVVISAAVRHDPEVAEWLPTTPHQAEAFTATVKGFADEQFELWAVR